MVGGVSHFERARASATVPPAGPAAPPGYAPPVLQLAGIRIDARSIGGLETYVDLPDWKLCFDVGRCPKRLLRRGTILFTHAHMDHLGGIAYHCATRSLLGMPPPRYVVPIGAKEPLRKLFAAWRELDRSTFEHELIGLAPGERYPHRSDVAVEAFAVPHTVPCLGYVVWHKTKRLDPRYEGLAQDELQRLARSGAALSLTEESPALAFLGDTRIEGLDAHPAVRRARVLVLECTFLDERVPAQEARTLGHVHLDEIASRADWFENEALLLTHFSQRYHTEEIRELVRRKLPARLFERVTLLTDDEAPGSSSDDTRDTTNDT
jgi:ribonuclease Z